MLQQSREMLSAEVVATGLSTPCGITGDSQNDLLYVAERDANRISAIHNQKVIPIIESDFRVRDEIPLYALSKAHPRDFWTQAALREPVDLTITPQGFLYVIEGVENGRILKFDPLQEGVLQASIIFSPWIDMPYAYSSITVDKHDRLYLTSRNTSRTILAFGSVLFRATPTNWYLVDYGPFADFASPSVSPDAETLIIGEYRQGDISWYDSTRQTEMAGLDLEGRVRHTGLLPDGRTLTALEYEDGTWGIVEVDPLEYETWEWVGGLSEIGGMYIHPQQGDIYVSLKQEGKIMRFRRLQDDPAEEPPEKGDFIQQIVRDFEMENALPPRDWPRFFKRFIDRLELVETANPNAGGAGGAGDGAGRAKPSMTMMEFSSAVPVVAAKVKARLLSAPENEPDPIKEISMLLFYPNQSSVTKHTIAPSISLFRAVHESGRVVQTRFLPNANGQPLSESMPDNELPDVLVSFPSGYYVPENPLADKGVVRSYFLGMGLGSDYWIDLDRNDPKKSRMIVEKIGGQRLDYALEPYNDDLQSGARTILVAGIKSVKTGWFDLGYRPILWKVIYGETPEINAKHWITLSELKPDTAPTKRTALFDGDLLSDEEISLRRKIVLRAATRWKSVHF
jgi:hypothetical protein